jgi:hypothetical protein
VTQIMRDSDKLLAGTKAVCRGRLELVGVRAQIYSEHGLDCGIRFKGWESLRKPLLCRAVGSGRTREQLKLSDRGDRPSAISTLRNLRHTFRNSRVRSGRRPSHVPDFLARG